MTQRITKKQLALLVLVLVSFILVTWYIDYRKASPKPYFTQSPPFEAPKWEEALTEHVTPRAELEKLLKQGLTEEETMERFGPNKPIDLSDETHHHICVYAYPPAVIERLAVESPTNYGIGLWLEFAKGHLVNAYEMRNVVRNQFLDGETLLRELSLGDSPETVVALLGEPPAIIRHDETRAFLYRYEPEKSDGFPAEYKEAILTIEFQDKRLVNSQYAFTPKNATETTEPIAELLARRICHLHGEDSDGIPYWEEPYSIWGFPDSL